MSQSIRPSLPELGRKRTSSPMQLRRRKDNFPEVDDAITQISITAEIHFILERRIEGIKIPARAGKLKDMDEPTKFFLSKEKFRGTKKITALQIQRHLMTVRTEIAIKSAQNSIRHC
jgi:hypothetical protein